MCSTIEVGKTLTCASSMYTTTNTKGVITCNFCLSSASAGLPQSVSLDKTQCMYPWKCGAGTMYDAGSNECYCPAGMVIDLDGTACVLPTACGGDAKLNTAGTQCVCSTVFKQGAVGSFCCANPNAGTCLSNAQTGANTSCINGYLLNLAGNCVDYGTCLAANGGPNTTNNLCCAQKGAATCLSTDTTKASLTCTEGYFLTADNNCVNADECASDGGGLDFVHHLCCADQFAATCLSPDPKKTLTCAASLYALTNRNGVISCSHCCGDCLGSGGSSLSQSVSLDKTLCVAALSCTTGGGSVNARNEYVCPSGSNILQDGTTCVSSNTSVGCVPDHYLTSENTCVTSFLCQAGNGAPMHLLRRCQRIDVLLVRRCSNHQLQLRPTA